MRIEAGCYEYMRKKLSALETCTLILLGCRFGGDFQEEMMYCNNEQIIYFSQVAMKLSESLFNDDVMIIIHVSLYL